MKFTEFCNRQKNVVQHAKSRRAEQLIPITEERDKFYNGQLFKKYDSVESDGKQYRILEQCANYYQVVDSIGTVTKKFAKQLTKTESTEQFMTESLFHGYKIQTSAGKLFFKENFDINSLKNDDVGILKQLKEADNMSNNQMTIAKIIADACGVKHDVVSDPSNLVRQSMQKALHNPNINKEILAGMIDIAREAGISIKEHIEKTEGGYKLVSKKTGKNLGTSTTLAGIKKREGQVEFFKHQNESVELDETSRAKVDSYLDKVKDSKPALNKVVKRFAGMERAHDRVHTDELKKIRDRLNTANESEETNEDVRSFVRSKALGLIRVNAQHAMHKDLAAQHKKQAEKHEDGASVAAHMAAAGRHERAAKRTNDAYEKAEIARMNKK